MDNVKTSIFGGTIGLNGAVSTKEPTFTMDLGLNQVNIAESFTQLDLKTCSTCRNYKWKIELYHKIKRKFE
jgi:hypothetical protein